MVDTPAGKQPRRARKKAEPEPRGLTARQVGGGVPPAAIMRLMETMEADGGAVIGPYREPLGSLWQVMAALPLERGEPTPYQRDLSEPHVTRLALAMEKLGRFVDPIIVVRTEEGKYWTPNGHHRLAALRSMGVRSVVALVVPEPEVAHRILVLNTEKSHNVRERAMEVIRLAEALCGMLPAERTVLGRGIPSRAEADGDLRRGKTFPRAGGPPRPGGTAARARRHGRRGGKADAGARPGESYLKAFVLARINPLRFKRGAADPDDVIAQMLASARRFDADKVKPDQVARAGGVAEEG